MEKRRIEKNYNPEPNSFEELVKKYTKKHPDKLAVCVVSSVPLYIVNVVSGLMSEITNASIFKKKYCGSGIFCSITIYKKFTSVSHFKIYENNKLDNSVTTFDENTLDEFYASNYVLFLHQKDAALYSKNIFLKKKKKLEKEIELLEFLSI